MQILLASQSPRRQQLLKDIGLDFKTIQPKGEEIYPNNLDIKKVPLFLAQQKSYSITLNTNEILITADTIVIVENEIIGKPKDEKEAIAMLQKLSNKKHVVITGVYIRTLTHEKGFDNQTSVYFKNLSEKQINYYISNYKPLDKAGSYGIQDWIGLVGIQKIEGCFYNVMGLPVSELYEVLQKDFQIFE
jgi:septum formation protein